MQTATFTVYGQDPSIVASKEKSFVYCTCTCKFTDTIELRRMYFDFRKMWPDFFVVCEFENYSMFYPQTYNEQLLELELYEK